MVAAAAWGCSRSPAPTSVHARGTPDVVELAAAEARDRMAAGTLTSRALTQAYLNRIAAIDDAGPRLNAVIEINPKALADADALDAERHGGKVRGPLHGIPVLLKDNIDVAGMANSAGSLAMARTGRPATRSSSDEVASGRRGDCRQDEPERVGQLQVVAIDVGMELSRRADEEPLRARPQSRAGPALAPARPSRRASPRSGSAPKPTAASSARPRLPAWSVSSRRWAWSAAAASSRSRCPRTPPGRWGAPWPTSRCCWVRSPRSTIAIRGTGRTRRIPADYLSSLDAGALKGKRLGVLRQAMGFHPDVDKAIESAIAAMKAGGAEVVDVKIGTYNDWNDRSSRYCCTSSRTASTHT